jgi:hypothetical protein
MRVEWNQQKNGLPAFACLSMKNQRAIEELLIHHFHPLCYRRPGVFDPLLTDPAELGVPRSSLPACQLRSTARGPNFLLNSGP